VKIARQSGSKLLEATSLSTFCDVMNRAGRFSESESIGNEAMKLFQELNNPGGEAKILWTLSYANSTEGNSVEALELGKRSNELYKLAGDLTGQANALNVMSIAESDPVKKREYLEQSLILFSQVGNRERMATIRQNLAIFYINVGLYKHALSILEKTSEFARSVNNKLAQVYSVSMKQMFFNF
jgi:tetratricopeptide (TPR) repeat protein